MIASVITGGLAFIALVCWPRVTTLVLGSTCAATFVGGGAWLDLALALYLGNQLARGG